MKYVIPSFGSHNSGASLKLAVDSGGGFAMLARAGQPRRKAQPVLTDVVVRWELTVPERELSRNSRWDASLSLRSPGGSLLPLI